MKIFERPSGISMIVVLAMMAGIWHPACSQYQPADEISKKFEQYRKQSLQEKIYVHTDRSSYLTGETMWFKVYLTDGSLHQPLGMSKVVYLEIADEHHKPVLQTKIGMADGKGNGSLYVSPSIGSGNYVVRAYTNWMKNFPPDFFFHTPITIVNTFRKLETSAANSSVTTDLQFFPEGGNMVNGVPSKVAFRATDATGKGISFRGAVVNHKNDTIAIVSPVRAGIGTFMITPEPGMQYRAVVRHADGSITHHALPPAEERGYTLRLHPGETSIRVEVQTRGIESTGAVQLFAHARNNISYSDVRTLSNGTTTFEISKQLLPEGISHLTLFDSRQRPVCERLWFRQPQNLLDIQINREESSSYLTRRRVAIDLKTLANDKPGPADLSVSVYQLDSLPQHEGNIVTSFWLTSDLKGTVENPEYYFSSASPEVLEAADNLMLTHGWRRFRWDDVLGNDAGTPFIPEYRGHIIRGTVLNEDGTPARHILTFLSTPSKTVRLNTALSDANGEVMFETQKFHGSSRVIAQTNFSKDSTYRIRIANPFDERPVSHKVPAFLISPAYHQSILERSVAMQVQDVYYEEELEASSQLTTDSTAFYGSPDQSYYLDDYTRFPVMEEVMREYVPGVWVRKRRDGFHFMVMDHVNRTVFDKSPLLLIDGVPFFDEDQIMQFDPLKVKLLEVFTRQYYLGPTIFPGIVSYRTYTGDLAGFQLDVRATILDYDGLQRQREFYSPRYDTGAQRRSRLPDQRTLLYWNPSVTTDASGNTQVEFFTSDASGTFRVVVEGITGDGKVGTGSLEFRVSGEM